MTLLKRMVPDTLAGRFILLLAGAILTANLIGLVILGLQQRQFDRETVDDRWVARMSALVTVLDTVDDETRLRIARNASSRFAEVRVEKTPLVSQMATDSRSLSIAQEFSETLDRDDVIVALVTRPRAQGRPSEDQRNRADPTVRGDRVIAVTLPLAAQNGQPAWLNVTTRASPSRPGLPRFDGNPFLTFLALSLLFVLGVGTLFAARLTKPLRLLSHAAQAAGRGDRSARVPEEGAREMRDAARAFNAMQSEISQFDAERMRMLAAVGHDLRTPMTSLRIRAEMIDDEDQRTAMIRTLDEMTIMANGLVSYAKDGRDGEDMQPLDLDALLAKLCEDRGAHYIGASGIKIMGRPVGLGRAIGNLIDNALRYGNTATVTLRKQDQNAIVTVDDTGPGIPPDRLEDMFQPFTRADDSRNSETGGAGLGLSIARTLILAHGGTVSLENRASGGLRATIKLQRIR